MFIFLYYYYNKNNRGMKNKLKKPKRGTSRIEKLRHIFLITQQIQTPSKTLPFLCLTKRTFFVSLSLATIFFSHQFTMHKLSTTARSSSVSALLRYGGALRRDVVAPISSSHLAKVSISFTFFAL